MLQLLMKMNYRSNTCNSTKFVSILLIVLHKCNVLYSRNNKLFSDCRIDENNETIQYAISYVMKYRSESFEKVAEDLVN